MRAAPADRRGRPRRAVRERPADAGAGAARARRAPGRHPWPARVPVADAARLPARAARQSGGLGAEAAAVREAWREWRDAEAARADLGSAPATATRGSSCCALRQRARGARSQARRGRRVAAGARVAAHRSGAWPRARAQTAGPAGRDGDGAAAALGRVAGAAAAARRARRRPGRRAAADRRSPIACREALGALDHYADSLECRPRAAGMGRSASGGLRGDRRASIASRSRTCRPCAHGSPRSWRSSATPACIWRSSSGAPATRSRATTPRRASSRPRDSARRSASTRT